MKKEPPDEIRRAMKKEGLSFRDVDARGYSMGSLSRILRGTVSPSWVTIKKIAGVLGYVAEMRFRKKGNKDG